MVKAKVQFNPNALLRSAKAGTFASLGHAGGTLRKVARNSIKRDAKRSPAGTPPHTRKGRLRNAIRYAVVKATQSVVIGPDQAIAGTVGKAHEFGGRYRNEQYERRPFMGPALEQIRPRLPAFWAGSVKG